jgi:predicted ATP-grasp superfamily ATP-dependent carboligase
VISGDPLPTNIPVNDQNWYVAQELLAGDRFRSYSVVRNGQVEATGVYRDTGDSAIKYVYHQQFHPGIYDYIHDFVSTVPAFNGQIAFDFVETSDGIYAVECNPRATPGLHLWCNTLWLARALTGSLPREIIERPIRPPRRGLGHESHAQVPAGLLE